jgi:hypothetical protein
MAPSLFKRVYEIEKWNATMFHDLGGAQLREGLKRREIFGK